MKKNRKRKKINLKRIIHGLIQRKKDKSHEGLKDKINPDAPFIESKEVDQNINLDQGHEPYEI
jgi:hypothetical protein